jgi:SHS2 domain-containing protein
MTHQSGYQILEHTADKGVRAWGSTLEKVFENAARGMYRLVIDPQGTTSNVVVPVHIEASEPVDHTDLLVKWLRELIYLTDVQKIAFTDFTVHRVTHTSVDAEARGLYIEDNSQLDGAPVKAVTYHLLRLERKPDGWEAEFYVDV